MSACVCVCVFGLYRSNPQHVSCFVSSVIKKWLAAVMSSSLQSDICQKPSLWQRIWGSSQPRDGLLLQCTAKHHLQESDACNQPLSLSVLIHIRFSHIKEQYTLSFIIIITQGSSLYHLPTLLLLQEQRSMYPHGFSVMIINLNRLFARKTIYIPVIGSCVKLLSDF